MSRWDPPWWPICSNIIQNDIGLRSRTCQNNNKNYYPKYGFHNSFDELANCCACITSLATQIVNPIHLYIGREIQITKQSGFRIRHAKTLHEAMLD